MCWNIFWLQNKQTMQTNVQDHWKKKHSMEFWKTVCVCKCASTHLFNSGTCKSTNKVKESFLWFSCQISSVNSLPLTESGDSAWRRMKHQKSHKRELWLKLLVSPYKPEPWLASLIWRLNLGWNVISLSYPH